MPRLVNLNAADAIAAFVQSLDRGEQPLSVSALTRVGCPVPTPCKKFRAAHLLAYCAAGFLLESQAIIDVWQRKRIRVARLSAGSPGYSIVQ